MNSRVEEAVARKRNGYNCAQAIACTYVDYTTLDEQTIAALTKSLGTGIGATLEGTCGAITGACIVAGLNQQKNPTGNAMLDAKSIVKDFKERNASITCKELKGIESGTMLRNCEDCVRDAAEFLEKVLSLNE